MKKFNDWQCGWLSGIIDSDGGVYFNRANGSNRKFITVRIQVDGTSENFIRKIHKIVGEGSVSAYRKSRTKGLFGKTFRPMFRFQACANTVRWVLPQLTLIAKSQQQKIILEALPILKKGRWKSIKEEQKLRNLFEQCRMLNMSGNTISKSKLTTQGWQVNYENLP